jgi:hypothetical protein
VKSVLLLVANLLSLSIWSIAALAQTPVSSPPAPDLWELARQSQDQHRFSTLFTAQDVRERLSSAAGLEHALQWCKQTGVTKVYVEEFRDGYQAERETLVKARDLFRQQGLLVSGCITPTKVGKPSTGWQATISCCTDLATQDKIQAIFEFAASLFDEVMIDDFWFTDCACPECEAARKSKTVRIGTSDYPVNGDTWEDYRCELMLRVSRDRLLAPAKKINPRVRLIIKYPQWYDRFHERGYDVARETAAFDEIWVGTESRDYGDKRWGGTVQYESYFIMRWLGGIGGAKCGGGWYDWLGTTERTYVEQARQTILGGARESMLFCYGGLQGSTGPKDVDALRANIPELLGVAGEVRKRTAVGLAAYKPANSHPEDEARVFDFVGMLGFPLAPCHEFPSIAPAAFFSMHALKDANLITKLNAFIESGRPVLVTDGLARRLQAKLDLSKGNVHLLAVKGDPKSLLQMPAADLQQLRSPLLNPFHVSFEGPNRVGLYLFGDGSWVVENFTDDSVTATINQEQATLGPRSWRYLWK